VTAHVSREAALAIGHPHYHGRPCLHGHDGERYTSDHSCVACKTAGTGRHPPSRDAALLDGRSRYWGKPCRHGHSGERYTCDKKCVVCTYLKHCRLAGVEPNARYLAGAAARGRALPAAPVRKPRPVKRARPLLEARSLGEHYYHGRPCKRCHGTWRYTCNSDCVACLVVAARQRRRA
jgi:hypothetical protein